MALPPRRSPGGSRREAPFHHGLLGKSLLAPRLVSLLCVMGLLGVVAGVVRALGSPWPFSVVAIGLMLMKVNWWRWLVLARPDGLGSLLLFLALVIHWRWPFRLTSVVAAVLLLVAAFFTKVYFVLGAASLFLSYALVHRDRGWALRFAGVFAILFGTALVTVLVWTRGLYWVFSFQMLSVLIERSTPMGLTYLAGFLIAYLPLWLLLAAALFRRSLDVRRYNVFLVHVLVATPATTVLLTNTGGAGYYWYIVLPALVVVACHLLAEEYARADSRLAVVTLALMLVAGFAAQRSGDALPSEAMASRWAPLRDKVASAAGPVMNNNLTAIVSIATGKELYCEALEYARNTAWLHDKYGYRFVTPAELIRQGHYALLMDPPPTPSLDKNYALSDVMELPGQFGTPVRVTLYDRRHRE